MSKPPYKMTLQINYTNYVMDEDVAIEVFKLLNKSILEVTASKWDNTSGTSTNYLSNVTETAILKCMTPEDYAVLKLATAAIEEQKK